MTAARCAASPVATSEIETMHQGMIRRLRLPVWSLCSLVTLSVAGGVAWANHIHLHSGAFGGIVLGVTADQENPQVLYAVVFGAGVYKSTSGDRVWTGMNRGLENPQVLSLVQDAANPEVLYVGTDAGVFKTTSGGEQWLPTRRGLEEHNVRALALSPPRPGRLFAATEAGVYRSDDGGGQWSPAREGLDSPDVRALAIDPTNPDRLYAATFGGVYRSDDGGHTWRPTVDQPLDRQVRALALDPLHPETVYTGTARGGVYRSTDGGATWTALNEGLGSLSVMSLTATPTAPATVYAGTVAGLYRFTAAEARWTLLGDGRILSITAITVDPHHADGLYVGSGGVLFKTLDGGHTWTDISQWVLNPTPFGSTPSEKSAPSSPVTGHSTRERR
jgi:photosystem II stability/assembly factor-like uncharacterized protein